MNWEDAVPLWVKDVDVVPYVNMGQDDEYCLDCSLGSNPLGAPPEVMAHWGSALSLDFVNYNFISDNLLSSVREYWDNAFEPCELIFGTGSIGLLAFMAKTLISPKSVVLGIAPQFTDAPMHFRLSGGTMKYHFLRGPHYQIATDELISQITDDVSIVYIDRPHNPTGQIISIEKTKDIALACKDVGVLLIVDEAYGGFMPDGDSAIHLAMKNVICLRSFSKGWGMAGVRAGYAVVRDAKVREYYSKVAPPFTLNVWALDLLPVVLKQREYLREQMKKIVQGKRNIVDIISSTPGFSIAKSCETVPIMLISYEDVEVDLYKVLLEAGLKTEPGLGFYNLGANSVRLRIPAPDDVEMFRICWDRVKLSLSVK